MSTLQGKVAVITGGASGIGAASVERFVAAGAKVVFADLQDDRGRALAESLGPGCSYRHADVSRDEDVRALIDEAVSRHGRLDCLFNNAGFGGPNGSIEALQPADFDRVMAVLLRSVFLGMHYAAPVMKRQRSGSIVSTASVAGLQAGFASHIYSAAKAGVVHLTRSVAMELGEHGVRVNCICPGGIATPIFGKAYGLDAAQADATLPLMQAALAGMQPLPRAGMPVDIAEAALWLASDASTFVNGHAMVVDGGLTGGRLWSPTRERGEALARMLKPGD